MQFGVGSQNFLSGLILEGLCQYCAVIIVMQGEDIHVSLYWSYMYPTCLVSVCASRFYATENMRCAVLVLDSWSDSGMSH